MFHGFSISSIMCADDLVLLSPSIYELQLMVEVCCNELNSLDLRINLDKSASLRIGKGCNKICRNIQAMESNINWVTEAKYLGLCCVVLGKNVRAILTNRNLNFIALLIAFSPNLEI